MNKKLVNACILCLIIIVGCILINTFRGKNNINEGFVMDGWNKVVYRGEDWATSATDAGDEEAASATDAGDEAALRGDVAVAASRGDAVAAVGDEEVVAENPQPLSPPPASVAVSAAVDISNDANSLETILQQFNHEILNSPIGQLKIDVDTYKKNQSKLFEDIDKYCVNIDKNITYYSSENDVNVLGTTICDKYIKPLKKAKTYKKELNNLLSKIDELTSIVSPKLNDFKNKKMTHINDIGRTNVTETITYEIQILNYSYIDYLTKFDKNNINRKNKINEILGVLEKDISHIDEWINLNLHSDRSDSKYTDVDGLDLDANYQPDEWCFNTEGVDNECLTENGKSYGCEIHCKNFEIVLGDNGEQINKCSQGSPDKINYNLYTNVTVGQNPYKFHSHIHEHIIGEGEGGELMPANNEVSLAGSPLIADIN